AQKNAHVLIVDESIHSGHTLAKAVILLREFGFADTNLVVLNPAEPAFPDWKASRIFQSLSKITTITLEPEERYKQRLLDSNAVEVRLQEYFQARGYVEARVSTTAQAKRLNLHWQEKPPERVDVRRKRIYPVKLKRSDGAGEVRYVLAKSVGWGWLSYHAFLAAQKLSAFVPPLLGLREGILYSEWVHDSRELPDQTQDRSRAVEAIASYVASRSRELRFDADPASDLALEGRHKGLELLAGSLSRAYG